MKKSKKAKKTRRSFSLGKKLEFIRYYKNEGKYNVSQTERNFNVSRSCIKNALENESLLLQQRNDKSKKTRVRRRLPKLRKPKFPTVDSQVFKWFKCQRSNGLIVTSDDLQMKGLRAAHEHNIPHEEFKASKGWLKRFIQRNKLTSRVATTVGQKIPENSKDISL